MLTEVEIDGPSTDEAMWKVSQIADRDGISKQAVSKRVKILANTNGLIVKRGHNGKVLSVNVVQYDLLCNRYGDQSQVRKRRESPFRGRGPLTVDLKSYDEATRQRAWLDMEKRRLEVAELHGKLIRADRYGEAVSQCAAELARIIDLLPQEAEAVAIEVGADDVHRLRLAFKGVARRLRIKLSSAFEALEKGAPERDDPLPDLVEGVS